MLFVDIKKNLSNYTLDVNFSVANEIIVLFGPSGSGKTTILNIIAGLLKPDSGEVRLNDMIFNKNNKTLIETQKRKIGYLFQDYALFPHMTVKKNILYGAKKDLFSTPIMKSMLEVMSIEHLLLKYPKQISGGEKQRVALARALATEPQLLLLDEPFSALDKNTRIECQDELLRLHNLWKIPVILVTHDLEEAKKLSDQIIFIEQGKIINM